MTATKRKPSPKASNVVPISTPRPRKPKLTPAKVEAAVPPATRPIMNIAVTQRIAIEREAREALDEVSMIDAIDTKAKEAFFALRAKLDTEREQAIKVIEKTYANKLEVATDAFEEESKGRAALRGEYVEIAARCHAALTVDEAAIASYRQGLGDGVGQ